MTQTYDLNEIAKKAMIERGFIPDFSQPVQQETSALQLPPFPLDRIDVRDMRKLLFFSIDNDDSRDLDQLTYAEALSNGEYKIYVAVADVDLLVKQKSAIDARAAHNTTSVYTPTKVFPMLPEKLSTNLTSLNPGQDRLAMVFEATLHNSGCLKDHAIYLAYVHNQAQLAYVGVTAWLDGTAPAPKALSAVPGLDAQVRLQDTIAKRIAECREKHGALSIETIEPYSVLRDGIPIAISKVEKNRARLLIENFMIIANSISAQYSENKKIISLRRVVTVPKRWDKIVEVGKQYGYDLPATPDPKALEGFLLQQKKKDPLRFPDLSLTIVKLLGKGEYHVLNPGQPPTGHFGLALRDYAHSTAPNRRFPDLITQRLLLATLFDHPLPYSSTELQGLAEHCTQKEDDAEKVERRMRKSSAALVLSDQIGNTFDAIVTGVGANGNWVRVLNPPVEGKLIQGNGTIDVGDRIKVKLVHTDVEKGFIDFVKAP